MENKINIAELLKDCPKGMELDCTLFDDVALEDVDFCSPKYPIIIRRTKIDKNQTIYLTKYGQYSIEEDAKCVIFPEGKTSWDGFVPPCKFKDGDIVATGGGEFAFMLKKVASSIGNNICYGTCYFGVTLKSELLIEEEDNWYFTRLATEEEKQKLFDIIKTKGYKWDTEAKTLKKLIEPKFKVGDRIRHKTTNTDIIYEISKIYDDSYGLVNYTWMLYMRFQDYYELVPNKFDITTLKPFESKVLVRHNRDNKWCGSFFSHLDEEFYSHCYKFVTTAGKSYPMCIPYEGNEHLIGKTDDCDEYYKTWE